MQPNFGGALLNVCSTGSGTTDNGNLLGAQYLQGGPGLAQYLTFSDAYGYDGVNRLVNVTEGTAWGRGFDYDAYGNRWVDPSVSRTYRIAPPESNVYGTAEC